MLRTEMQETKTLGKYYGSGTLVQLPPLYNNNGKAKLARINMRYVFIPSLYHYFK